MMNRDTHSLFEAYRMIREGFEYFGQSKAEANEVNSMANEAGEETKKSKHSKSHYEGAAHVVHHALKDKHDKEELAEHMKKHMKKIYGDDFDEKKAEHAIKKATGMDSKSEDNEDDMKCTGKPDCKCKKCMSQDEDNESDYHKTFRPVEIMGSEKEYQEQERKREEREAKELKHAMKKAGLHKKK